MAALGLFIACNLAISNNALWKHSHCWPFWILLKLLIYVMVLPLSGGAYSLTKKSSLTSANRRNLRSSGPLTCSGACRALVLFSPTNASLTSMADDHCPGYVAAQRAIVGGIWPG